MGFDKPLRPTDEIEDRLRLIKRIVGKDVFRTGAFVDSLTDLLHSDNEKIASQAAGILARYHLGMTKHLDTVNATRERVMMRDKIAAYRVEHSHTLDLSKLPIERLEELARGDWSALPEPIEVEAEVVEAPTEAPAPVEAPVEAPQLDKLDELLDELGA